VECIFPIARSCRAPIGHPSPMGTSGRSFFCAHCGATVLICSCCDRGQRYCSEGCSQAARACSLRAAGLRYQSSRRGRRAHAERQRRYRARQKKVTHHGTPPPAPSVLLPPHPTAPEEIALSLPWHCHFCGRQQAKGERQNFLRCRIRRPSIPSDKRETPHGSDP
jgi:hypothetical protein